MTNIDTQIIFDKNGNPIPQYLDVSDKTGGSAGTMKPITGQNGAQFTQLTGSNVVIARALNRNVSAGGVVIPSEFNGLFNVLKGYSKYYVAIKSDIAGKTRIDINSIFDDYSDFGNPAYEFGGYQNILTTNSRTDISEIVDVRGQGFSVRVYNDHTQDRTFDILIVGVI